MIQSIRKSSPYLGALFLGVGIYLIGYQIPRENFSSLIGSFSLAFYGMYLLQQSGIKDQNLFGLGLIFRLILIFSIPVLSDDYFRFLWDGLIIQNGHNPFEQTPQELISSFPSSKFHQELYEGMNSPNYFSVYPPINQWIFYLSSLTGSIYGGIITLRLFIIGFEIGTYYIIQKILLRFSLPSNKAWWYWLNPLVILELTGNLHGEGILICFLLIGLYHLAKLKDLKGGLFIGLSVLSKLFSLMFLPILLLKGRAYRSKKLLLGLIPILIISFIPFLNLGNYQHIIESLDLYFQTFEFNGSVFNLIKWLGYQVFGFDLIKIAGPILSLFAFVFILIISWLYRFRNRLSIFKALTLMFVAYLFCSPIVHPWYAILPLALAIFTPMKFMIAWSGSIFLSYAAYSSNLSQEFKSLFIALEYIIVFVVLYIDLKPSFSWIKIKAGLAK